ncbi:MAG: hypothetical protein LM580_01100 [Thermofilum sp.]|jgi:isopentenyl phosphate kinase|nr:hypothetical protein [Thermofilum sp.]MCC6064357.1 hypothetical protein [Thermofilum sp.]
MRAGELLVVKLGGSLITDKRKPLTLNREGLEAAAEALARVARGRRLVVVHGGGSFGHYAVVQAGGSRERLVSDVSYWMSALNLEVVSALRAAGVPAVGLPPLAVARVDGGQLSLQRDVLEAALEDGTVPVTHGGLVLQDGRLEILSGDVLASEIAVKLAARTLAFLMDVDAVYTADPRSDPHARPLEVLKRSHLEAIRGGSSGIDVTGGILLKLREALRAAEAGVRVALGGVSELEAMVEGLKGKYTRVEP